MCTKIYWQNNRTLGTDLTDKTFYTNFLVVRSSNIKIMNNNNNDDNSTRRDSYLATNMLTYLSCITKELNGKCFWKSWTFASHQIVASDCYCRQNGPQGRSNGCGGAVEGLVMGVVDDVQRSAVGLFTGWLDLILRKLEAKSPIVSQLKGEGEWDPFKTSPVSGWTRVWVYKQETI